MQSLAVAFVDTDQMKGNKSLILYTIGLCVCVVFLDWSVAVILHLPVMAVSG